MKGGDLYMAISKLTIEKSMLDVTSESDLNTMEILDMTSDVELDIVVCKVVCKAKQHHIILTPPKLFLLQLKKGEAPFFCYIVLFVLTASALIAAVQSPSSTLLYVIVDLYNMYFPEKSKYSITKGSI